MLAPIRRDRHAHLIAIALVGAFAACSTPVQKSGPSPAPGPMSCVKRFRPAPKQCRAKKLPSRLLSILTTEGQRRLEECTHCADKARLQAYTEQQITQSFCGVATATTILNSMDGSKPCTQPYAPYPWFTQCNIFHKGAREHVNPDRVSRRGMTLQQNRMLLQTNGVRAGCAHAGGTKPATSGPNDCETVDSAAAFRKRVKLFLGRPGWHMAVNFKRGVLSDNGKGGGHFSPLAAYHAPTDSVLILDVARYKYPPFWVPVELLYKAMATRDSDSKRNRGFVFAFPL